MQNYHVLERIGEGSFGKVYKGRRKYTGQAVALKFISKHGKSEKDLNNLRQEIDILRTLNHENVIIMFDTFETDRDFCVVTEYAQGELFQILEDDHSLPEEEVQKIARQLVKVGGSCRQRTRVLATYLCACTYRPFTTCIRTALCTGENNENTFSFIPYSRPFASKRYEAAKYPDWHKWTGQIV
jgi:serine/threonine protein kinase